MDVSSQLCHRHLAATDGTHIDLRHVAAPRTPVTGRGRRWPHPRYIHAISAENGIQSNSKIELVCRGRQNEIAILEHLDLAFESLRRKLIDTDDRTRLSRQCPGT